MGKDEKPVISASEFLRGQRHCEQGLPHQEGQHPDYDRGYATEYAWQECMSHRTAYQEERMH